MIFHEQETKKKILKKAMLNIKKRNSIIIKLFVKDVDRNFIEKDCKKILKENIDVLNVMEN